MLFAAPTHAAGSPAKSAQQTVVSAAGNYSVKIAGYYTGTGTATISGTSLSIKGTVADSEGHKGDLTAANLPIDGTFHFTGTGTIVGISVTLSGRLDPSNPKEGELKTARVVCTYTVSSDVQGRIVGYVPVPPNTLPPAKRDGTPPTSPTDPSSPAPPPDPQPNPPPNPQPTPPDGGSPKGNPQSPTQGDSR